jgi:hypothetical protein
MIEPVASLEGRHNLFNKNSGLHRQEPSRGLFSFLTWPFFLAQMWAAQEFLGAGFKAATADAAESNATPHAPSGSAASPGQSDLAASHSRSEDSVGETGPVNTAGTIDATAADAAKQPDKVTDEFSNIAAAENNDPPLPPGGGGGISADGGGGASASEAGAGAASASTFSGGVLGHHAPTIGSSTLDIGAKIPVLSEAPHIIDVLADVIGISSPDVTDIVPLRALADSIFSSSTDLLAETGIVLNKADIVVDASHALVESTSDLVAKVIDVASPVVTTGLGVLTPVTHDVVGTANELIGDAIAIVNSAGSILHNVDAALDVAAGVTGISSSALASLQPTFSLVGHPADTVGNVLSLASNTDAGAINIGSVQDVLSAPLQILGSVSHGVSWDQSHGAVASDGIISFPVVAAVEASTSDLFANGGHTDYGLALHNDVAELGKATGQSIEVKTVTGVDTVSHAVDSVVNQPSDDHASHTAQPMIGEVASALDHIGINSHSSLF